MLLNGVAGSGDTATHRIVSVRFRRFRIDLFGLAFSYEVEGRKG